MTETASTKSYPRDQRFGNVEVTIRQMSAADREAVLAFTRSLPEQELLFLRMDITQGEVVDAWIGNIESGKTVSLLAEVDGQLAAYCSLHHSEILWTRHFGEIRMLVDPRHRSKGIGRALARQIFELARELGLKKLVVQMMSSQHDAQTLFHQLGFIPEAMLHDWAIDRAGRTHDMIVMSREVDDEP